MLEFKNIKTEYPLSLRIKDNNKTLYLNGLVDGEDIKVDKNKVIIENESKERINTGCKYQDICGGCQFMHVNYDYEIKVKKEYLNNLFHNIKKDIDIIKSDNIYNYRNKCQMNYKLSAKGNIIAGLYEEHSHNIITVDSCMIQASKANEVIAKINDILKKNKILPYDGKGRGVLKNIFIRYGFNSKELLLVFVTSDILFPGSKNLVNDLVKSNLGITTIIQNINPRNTPVVLGDKEKVLYGPGYIYEYIDNYKFKISANSFFQINTNMMSVIYNTALNEVKLEKSDVIVDAYSGIGSISIFASKYVNKVISVELNKNAYQDAKINAKLNNINNINFINEDATKFLVNLAETNTKIDALIMDPPRDGSTFKFISAISKLKIKDVIYISCNPETLKRDLEIFNKFNYELTFLKAVDNFPKTQHVEMVSILRLKGADKKKDNTLEYKKNKIRYIPKADIEMSREDKFEAGYKINKKRH